MLLHKRRQKPSHDERFWYKKFYKESRMGQLMVLRSDKPELHGGREIFNWELPSSTAKQLQQTNRLLWVLIVLMGLVLFRVFLV